MCEYDYSERAAACNETRIYPPGCCPNDSDEGCCSCNRRNNNCCGCGCRKHNKCCEPVTVTGDDGVTRTDYCPSCADTCK